MSTYNGRGIHGQVVEAVGRRVVTGRLAEVRQMFEPAAAALAAARLTDADLAELEAAVQDMTLARTSAEAVSADLRFHRAVLAATGNELLVRMEVVVEDRKSVV